MPPPPKNTVRALVFVGQRNGTTCRSDKAAVCRAVSQFPRSVYVSGSVDSGSAFRYALAAGAKEVVAPDYEADVILFGRGGTETAGDLLPAKVAVERDAGLVLDVLDVELDVEPVDSLSDHENSDHENRGTLRVTRDLGRGGREILTVGLPVVLVMAESAAPTVYISRFRQMQVSPTVLAELPQYRQTYRWNRLRPRTVARNLAHKTSGSATNRMLDAFGLTETTGAESSENVSHADPATCATHILRYLAHHALIDLRGVVGDDKALVPPTANAKTEMPVEARQVDPTSVTDVSRAPRPLPGGSVGMHRRPRAYPALSSLPSHVLRRPRPIGTQIQPDYRGPFPVSPS